MAVVESQNGMEAINENCLDNHKAQVLYKF